MKGSSPKVSVVLPFYNAEKTLTAALQSISDQEFADFECLMVDNNSSDESRELAARWQGLDPRFILLEERRQGVMFASNRGSEEARGAYIARMDADDVSRPGRLSMQCEFLDAHPDFGAVAGLALHVGDPETTAGFRRFVEWSNSVITFEDIYNKRFIEAPIVNPTAMWRREIMECCGGYLSGEFPEDYEMWLRWLDQGVKIEKIPEVVLDWHDSKARLSRTQSIYSEQSFYKVKSRYLARWLSAKNPFHPEVTIWGASRISRRRARMLEQHGIEIQTYIDTSKKRQIDKGLTYYADLPKAGSIFILTYIGQMDRREKIQAFLEERGYVEGKDYLLVS